MAYFLRIFAVVFYISLLLTSSFSHYGEQQFSYLSRSFITGRVDINNYHLGYNDASYFNGNYYWPLGPFPAIVITPFVFMGAFFNTLFLHRYVHWLFVLGVFYMVYKIARIFKFGQTESIILAFAFNLGSVFIGVSLVPWSWYFSQVICTLLVFTALYEYFDRRRYFIIGLLFSCILLTRVTAFLGIIFFILEVIRSDRVLSDKFRKLSVLFIPILISGILFCFYNYARYKNIFEQGYQFQILQAGADKARSYGLFSIVHVPANLYYFLIAPPVLVLKDNVTQVTRFPHLTYSMMGMGIIFTSIYMLKLLFINFKNGEVKNLLFTSFVIFVPIMFYYGIGASQYGYRYSLDFLPYLFLIILFHYKNSGLGRRMKLAMFFSIFLNLFLLFSKSLLI